MFMILWSSPASEKLLEKNNIVDICSSPIWYKWYAKEEDAITILLCTTALLQLSASKSRPQAFLFYTKSFSTAKIGRPKEVAWSQSWPLFHSYAENLKKHKVPKKLFQSCCFLRLTFLNPLSSHLTEEQFSVTGTISLDANGALISPL